jgi:hypothetical protein
MIPWRDFIAKKKDELKEKCIITLIVLSDGRKGINYCTYSF